MGKSPMKGNGENRNTSTENGHKKKGLTAQLNQGIGFNGFGIKNDDLITSFFDVAPG